MQKDFLTLHNFEKKFKEIIASKNLFKKNDFLIIGFSGGPDSTLLLYLLNKLFKYENEILAVHINHNLRKTAKDDENFASEFCKKNNINLKIFSADIKKLAAEKKLSVEEEGRNFRYDVFYNLAKKINSEKTSARKSPPVKSSQKKSPQKNSVKILTAHHKDDQVETILFRLCRGTGAAGLSGIKYEKNFKESFNLIRPLLDFSKAEILEYAKIEKINFAIDESNFGTDYKRNKIRNELIPYLEKNYNENIKEAIYRFGKSANIVNEFLEKEVCEFLEKFSIEKNEIISFSFAKIKNLDKAILIKLIIKSFEKIGLENDIEMVHIDALLRILDQGEGNKVAEFPHGYRASLKNKTLKFFKNSRNVDI